MQHTHSFFSFEGTCTPTPPIWGYIEFFEDTVCGSLYYCPIKHCLKHCMFSYDMAIPDEIVMLVCLYQVQMYMFLLRNKSWKPTCSGATYLMVKDAFPNAI